MRKIYYQRDAAGWNNVRLQFEMLVGLAALTGRQLVIPPPTNIAHIWQAYYELEMYSSTALASVISFTTGTETFTTRRPEVIARELGAFHISQVLKVDYRHEAQQTGLRWDYRQYPVEKDWVLGGWESRLLHFECLEEYGAMDEEQRLLVSNAVFYGVRPSRHHVLRARRMLDELSLRPGGFIGAHIRREDFTKTNKEYHDMSGTKITDILNEAGGDLPLVVATNALPDDDIFQRMLNSTRSRKVIRIEDYFAFADDVDRLWMTILIMSYAFVFAGTLFSTYTLHVEKLRTQVFWHTGDMNLAHLYAQIAHPWDNDHNCRTMYSSTTAWVVTTFADVRTFKDAYDPPIVLVEADTRFGKTVHYYHLPLGLDRCPKGREVASSDECFRAIRQLGFSHSHYWRGKLPEVPQYCSLSPEGDPHAVFNLHPEGVGRADVAPVCRLEPRPTPSDVASELIVWHAESPSVLRPVEVSHVELSDVAPTFGFLGGFTVGLSLALVVGFLRCVQTGGARRFKLDKRMQVHAASQWFGHATEGAAE